MLQTKPNKIKIVVQIGCSGVGYVGLLVIGIICGVCGNIVAIY